MSEINYEISASMQNRFAVHRENRLKSNDVVSETSSREQLDSVEISDELSDSRMKMRLWIKNWKPLCIILWNSFQVPNHLICTG